MLLVAPNSAFVKRFIKLPLVLNVTGYAMSFSLSELLLILFGVVLQNAEQAFDYAAIIPLILGMAYTSETSEQYLGEATKNYEQLEVTSI